jgi:hypothetical protein
MCALHSFMIGTTLLILFRILKYFIFAVSYMQNVMILFGIWGVRGSNLGPKIGHPSFFRSFTSFLHQMLCHCLHTDKGCSIPYRGRWCKMGVLRFERLYKELNKMEYSKENLFIYL